MNGGTRWGFWAFIAALVVLHFVLRIGMGLEQLAPDLLIVALLLAAREMRAGWAAGLGLLFGILDGSLVPFNLGATAVVLTLVGFFGARSREMVAGDSLIFVATYLFIGKWVFDTLLYLLTGEAFGPTAAYLVLVSPIAALYAAAAGLVGISLYRAFA
jgi:cell shape-determining protein MreD